MLRQILRDLDWVIAFIVTTVILVLISFLIVALVTIKPAIPDIIETNIAPKQVDCRSEKVLTDEAGHKWDAMFFAQVNSPQVTSLNLRLSGLSSSVYIQSQAPLIIVAEESASQPLRYEVSDIFLEESPLPSIGQYDLSSIFSQLPTTNLVMEIPLEHGDSARLHIPQAVVEEWQEVASRNSNQSPRIPSSIELLC